MARERDFVARCAEGPGLVFDLDYEPQMHSRERVSVVQQIQLSYGNNKKAERPCAFHLTSCAAATEMRAQLDKFSARTRECRRKAEQLVVELGLREFLH